jgi:hypothetical protein
VTGLTLHIQAWNLSAPSIVLQNAIFNYVRTDKFTIFQQESSLM